MYDLVEHYAEIIPKLQNKGPPPNRLTSTNFDAGSSNLASERRETAGNLIFRKFFEIRKYQLGVRYSPIFAFFLRNFTKKNIKNQVPGRFPPFWGQIRAPRIEISRSKSIGRGPLILHILVLTVDSFAIWG